MLGDRRPDRLRNVLPLDDHFIRQAERLLQDEPDPLPMDRRVRIVFPLLKRQLQNPAMIRIMRVQSLRQHAIQHRDRKERPGDLDEGKPFVVVA